MKIFNGVDDAANRLLNFLAIDQGMLLFTADLALYTFLITSIVLTIMMMIAQPRNLLDVSLTIRQGVLSAVLGIGLIVRWQGGRLPLWFLTTELVVLSLAGILVITALFREYFWFYWHKRRKQ